MGNSCQGGNQVESISNYIETEEIRIQLIKKDIQGRILDIGGGGEGFIGSLYGSRVIAIDKLKTELEETNNDALKIVMDAADMKFLERSFAYVTLFYSLMYMNVKSKRKSLEEAYRVLDDDGVLEIWDMEVPVSIENADEVIIGRIRVAINGDEISTGYGSKCKGREQTFNTISEILMEVGFEIIEVNKDGNFFNISCGKSD